ncbi:dTMP kinase [Enterococcus sp. MJM12]|uniref:Thymidylate kinase n=1 Tax=Candidatus Enterococcus myersii TaxID=2815322 RepID=A0ABS3H8H3_9ENTE|nr:MULTISPECIES: dTMP kinase [Enterococcus]MBO0449750.1 dTMP kinase [Enterococcus sp. MJM12]MCD1023793.1 dTMP kinase [Enterococcus sp. SMC-9]MDT2738378.1 dTMP kinase [Enterococcus canintestini]WHA08532.1 dTMP kinase [Enterococcus montenegrensis]
MNGLFITIEGPDGAGKTSVVNELFPRIQLIAKRGIVKTREPGGVKIAEKIRKIILDPRNEEMDDRTEALLYAAARRQHLVEVIMPALNAGKIVICDRFVDSSLAYQGAGRRIGIPEIAKINEFATEGLKPDFTLYLDVDSDTGLKRIENSRHGEADRLEIESLEFHQRVRHAYLKLAEEDPIRIHKVDARMSLQDVVDASFTAITEAYPQFF